MELLSFLADRETRVAMSSNSDNWILEEQVKMTFANALVANLAIIVVALLFFSMMGERTD